MNSFDSVKNYIIGWFWKIGYRIGQGLGNLGQSIFDNAIAIGFKTTILNNIDTGALLSSADDAIEQTVLNTIPDSVNLESADYASFLLLFMEEASDAPAGTYDIAASAAQALFVNVFGFTASTGKLMDAHVADGNGNWVYDGMAFWDDTDENPPAGTSQIVPGWTLSDGTDAGPIRDASGTTYTDSTSGTAVTKFINTAGVEIYIDNADGTAWEDVGESQS